jgi:hypothetical protein
VSTNTPSLSQKIAFIIVLKDKYFHFLKDVRTAIQPDPGNEAAFWCVINKRKRNS